MSALSHGYGQTFWVALGMGLVSVFPALLLVPSPKPEGADTMPEAQLPTGPAALTEMPETVARA